MKGNGRAGSRIGTRAGRRGATHRDLARFKRILRQRLPELQARYGVKPLGVFGSYVRGGAKKSSDLDVLVEFGDDKLSLFKFIELENYLSDLLGIKVDLVERQGLKPAIGRRIVAEVVQL
jgi:uncharacterized protein